MLTNALTEPELEEVVSTSVDELHKVLDGEIGYKELKPWDEQTEPIKNYYKQLACFYYFYLMTDLQDKVGPEIDALLNTLLVLRETCFEQETIPADKLLAIVSQGLINISKLRTTNFVSITNIPDHVLEQMLKKGMSIINKDRPNVNYQLHSWDESLNEFYILDEQGAASSAPKNSLLILR